MWNCLKLLSWELNAKRKYENGPSYTQEWLANSKLWFIFNDYVCKSVSCSLSLDKINLKTNFILDTITLFNFVLREVCGFKPKLCFGPPASCYSHHPTKQPGMDVSTHVMFSAFHSTFPGVKNITPSLSWSCMMHATHCSLKESWIALWYKFSRHFIKHKSSI